MRSLSRNFHPAQIRGNSCAAIKSHRILSDKPAIIRYRSLFPCGGCFKRFMLCVIQNHTGGVVFLFTSALPFLPFSRTQIKVPSYPDHPVLNFIKLWVSSWNRFPCEFFFPSRTVIEYNLHWLPEEILPSNILKSEANSRLNGQTSVLIRINCHRCAGNIQSEQCHKILLLAVFFLLLFLLVQYL